FSKFMYFYIFYSYFREWIISMDGTIRKGIHPKYYRTIKCIFNIIKYTIVFVILLALIYYCMLFYCMLFGLYSVSLKDVLPGYSLCVISILLYDFLVTKVLRTMRFSNIFYIAFSDPMIVGEATEKSRATRQYGYARRYTSTDGL